MIIAICVTGCGDKESDVINNGNDIMKSGLSTSSLSINDFDWKVDEMKCRGNDCTIFKLTNNSKYDVIGVGIKYRVKDSATDEELKIFDSFMKKHDGYIDEDDSARDVTLSGDEDRLIEPGQSIDNIDVTVGFKRWAWYDYPTSRQFALMQPEELQLGIIYKNVLYLAYYNFDSKSWKLDNESKVVDVWTKSDLGKLVDKPECKHFVVVDDDEDYFKIYAYGATKEQYKDYIAKVKEKGFVDAYGYTTLFDGKDSDGNNVYITYDDDSESIILRVSPPSKY
jgi:hypothetical protein